MRLLVLLSLLLANAACPAWDVRDSWADVVLAQWRARKPLPTISAVEKNLNLEDAYGIQQRVVGELARQATLSGYRADLTSPLARARLRGDQPISAAVFKDQLLEDGGWVTLEPRNRLLLAPALGYTLARRVAKPLADTKDVLPLLAAVKPVVVLVDYRFEDLALPRVQDLVAANGAPTRLVVGRPFADRALANIDDTFVELRRNDAVIDRAKATNTLGGQLEALRWLINERVARDGELAPGQLLVTGPMSEPIPAETGDYLVDYWERGKLHFSVD